MAPNATAILTQFGFDVVGAGCVPNGIVSICVLSRDTHPVGRGYAFARENSSNQA